MLETAIAADPLLLSLYRKEARVPVFVQVFEKGKAPWRKPLCKLGGHDWVNVPLSDGLKPGHLSYFALPAKYLGFELDSCRRSCGVRRLWRPWRNG